METIVKTNLVAMKSDIKSAVENQKFLKNQRRTVKLVGERKIDPSEATYKHLSNREDLRIMYAAYGIARGKSLSQIENHYPEDNHPLNEPYNQRRIERILKKYEVEVPVEAEV